MVSDEASQYVGDAKGSTQRMSFRDFSACFVFDSSV
jgi:hypothetical protein